MAFDIGSAVAKIKADTTNFQQGIKGVSKTTNAFSSMMGKLGGIIATTFAVSKIINFGKQASQQAMNLEKAMISLEIISGKFGVSAKDAQRAARELGTELRIGVGASAESLQNLLKSGLNLDQAKDLMKRFTNEAITGKSANIDLATAVQNLSFAYATNNSALGNMSGVSENWSDIVDKGIGVMEAWNGKANEKAGITEELVEQIVAYEEQLKSQGETLEKGNEEQAKYIGLLQLTNLTQGSAAAFTGSLIDKQAILGQKMISLKEIVGDALNPILKVLTDRKIELIDKIINTITSVGDLTDVFIKYYDKIIVVATFLAVTFTPAIVMLGIQSLKTAVIGMATLILKTAAFIVEGWKAIAMLIVKIIKLGIATAAFILHTTITIAQTVAQIALTAATWLFNVAMAVLTSPIFLVVAAIVALIAIGFLLIKNWDKVKAFGKSMLDKLIQWWEGFVEKLKDVGGKILSAIMHPFEEAKRKIEAVVNWIKDRLDWTKRQSPSVIDIIERGVGLANKAYGRLEPGIAPIDTGQLATVGTGGGGISVNVDLAGAYIGDDDIGERIGDSIVKKLQKNVRF